MAQRSTRNRLMYQAKKAAESIEKSIGHLAYMEQLAEDRHPLINDSLPQIIVMLEGAQKVLLMFREQI